MREEALKRPYIILIKVLSIKTATSSGGHISASRCYCLNLKCSAELALKDDVMTIFVSSSVKRTQNMTNLLKKGIFKDAGISQNQIYSMQRDVKSYIRYAFMKNTPFKGLQTPWLKTYWK